MREVEVKAVVADVNALRSHLIAADAVQTFAGELIDYRYDSKDGTLTASDQMLRLRTYRAHDGTSRSAIDWKGPTEEVGGYKVREELSTAVGDASTLHTMLTQLGFVLVREVDRNIEMYAIEGAIVRIEHYPRLDVLVEVEGDPECIERAIERTCMPRSEFTSERLVAFVERFEARSGTRAALSRRELNSLRAEDAAV